MASISAASKSNASAEGVEEFDLEKRGIIGLTTRVVENQNIILPGKECYDLTVTIAKKLKELKN